MNTVKLYPHQARELEETRGLDHVAYYHDMGLGKTYTGAEKLYLLGALDNLIICQKSKIDDWLNHFADNYDSIFVFDLTDSKEMESFLTMEAFAGNQKLGIINYDLVFRRPELAKLKDFTLMLDESSLIQNENAKRSKFILKKLKPKNVILLSGTPTGGKYENLWSQLHLLGWEISKDTYWKQYVEVEYKDNEGFPIKIVKGYKNVDRLKTKMRAYGCRFLKTDEVFDLPEQVFNNVYVETTKDYRTFRKDSIVIINDEELVGDTILKKMLYERMLCGHFNSSKLDALKDLLESTEDRLIIFYNFSDELRAIEDLCLTLDKPLSIVNGQTKDLACYEQYDNSITAIQYQAGAMGLNLQRANKIVYFTPPLSSELFEQSKKRIHRIGQESSCFYYMLTCRYSVEERIYKTLEMRKDYTDALYINDNYDF